MILRGAHVVDGWAEQNGYAVLFCTGNLGMDDLYEPLREAPDARVRVAVGVLTETHPELQTTSVEQFLAILRFKQRGKLAELPGELVKGVRGVCFKFP